MGSTIRNDGFSRYAEFKSEYDTLRKIGRHWLEWKQARQDSKPLESAQHSLQSAMTEYKILRARMRLSIRGFNESAEAIEQKKQKTDEQIASLQQEMPELQMKVLRAREERLHDEELYVMRRKAARYSAPEELQRLLAEVRAEIAQTTARLAGLRDAVSYRRAQALAAHAALAEAAAPLPAALRTAAGLEMADTAGPTEPSHAAVTSGASEVEEGGRAVTPRPVTSTTAPAPAPAPAAPVASATPLQRPLAAPAAGDLAHQSPAHPRPS